MTFLNPILAWTALACIAIPILIHILMRRRRTPIPFGAMRFVIEAFRRQRRRMQLEQIILLAARCLLIALLALAVGGLASSAGGDHRRGPRTLFILIDNSLTSSAVGSGGESGLDRSRALALELLGSLDAGRGDRAALVALGAPPDVIVLPPTLDLGAVREHVASLTPTDSRADLPGALSRIRDDLARTQEATLVILSEFRAGSADPSTTLPSLPQGVAGVLAQPPAEDSPENIAVVSLDPLRPVLLTGAGEETSRTATFRVGLRRFGAGNSGVTRVQVRAATTAQAAPGAWGMVNWTPGQTEASLIIAPEIAGNGGTRVVAIASVDRDPVAGDNIFRRPLQTRERLEVALMARPAGSAPGAIDQFAPADWLALALSPQADLVARGRQSGEVRVNLIDPARPALPAPTGIALADADAVVIPDPELLDAAAWESVKQASQRGALVIVFPPAGVETHMWTDAFLASLSLDWTTERSARDLPNGSGLSPTTPAQSNLLAFLAGELSELVKPVRVARVLPLRATAQSMETLLALEDGTPFVAFSPATPRRGAVVCFAAAMHLSWTDLPTKPLMVPLMQEIVRQGVGQGGGERTGVAGQVPVLPQGAAELVRQRDEISSASPAHQVRGAGLIDPPIRTAGVYAIRTQGSSLLGLAAINADVSASATEARSRREILQWLSTLGPPVSMLDGEMPLPGSDERDDAPEAPWADGLLAAALALGIIEAFLGRWFSHAGAGEGLGADGGNEERRAA